VSSSKLIASEEFHLISPLVCVIGLVVIDAAATLEDIALPHFGLHELKGDRARHVGGESQQELEADLCYEVRVLPR
jgi:hypothetical protein